MSDLASVNRHNGHGRNTRDIVLTTTEPSKEPPMEQTQSTRPLRVIGAVPREATTQPEWTPLVEVFEDAGSIRILAEVPGVRLRDVSVALEGNRLTISGTKTRHEEELAVKVLRHERTYGEFKRTFRLGAVVDFAGVTAAYEDGVLTVMLPKAESAKRHQIAVSG